MGRPRCWSSARSPVSPACSSRFGPPRDSGTWPSPSPWCWPRWRGSRPPWCARSRRCCGSSGSRATSRRGRSTRSGTRIRASPCTATRRRPRHPAGWGLSAAYRPDRGIHQLSLLIDAAAGTVLTGFDGDSGQPRASQVTTSPTSATTCAGTDDVLVVGVGGGRDVLSALLFGQRSVLGVEINQAIVETVNGRFGDFTGHLDRLPRVQFVNDEARSYIARQRRALRHHPDLADRHVGGDRGRRLRAQRELALHGRGVDALPRPAHAVRRPQRVARYHFRSRPDEMYRLTALAHAASRAPGSRTRARTS